MQRRTFGYLASAATLSVLFPSSTQGVEGQENMYGLIGKIMAVEGKRDELIAALLAGTADMPGCLSYVIAKDATDDAAIWVTEVWASKDDHAASLSLPAVQQAIEKGRPMIAGFAERFETIPAGGHGLKD